MSKILVKYPTRSRPELFKKTLSEYIEKADDNSSITYLISFDNDDVETSDAVMEMQRKHFDNVIFFVGPRQNKIEACNRDIQHVNDWDILLLISDDMHVQVKCWDQIIRSDFEHFYPDFDGCMWYHDGSKQKIISTLSCIGRKYYDRFGYIYYPGYKSFFCDNEYTEVAQAQKKITFRDNVIIKHNHPQTNPDIKADELYRANDAYWNQDKELYYNRKSKAFK